VKGRVTSSAGADDVKGLLVSCTGIATAAGDGGALIAEAYSELPNELVKAPGEVRYAYRDTGGGKGKVPMRLFQHFRGNLDNWDPALVDALAAGRRVITFYGTPQTSPEDYLRVFFTQSPASVRSGQDALKRMYARSKDRDTATTWETREAQYDAVCTWGIPDHARLQRVRALRLPVFVANGDSDPMILPH
jgi:hypothetical protein